MDNNGLTYLMQFARERTGIVLTPEKTYLIESRLSKLIKSEGFNSLQTLTNKLRWQPTDDLVMKVIDALTTNETSFFRDNAPFEALKKTVLPQLAQSNAHTKTINIWSAACSSGQEPYSIKMIIEEHFPALKDWNVQIFATDISEEILAKAERGVYTSFEVSRGLPQNLKKYLVPSGTSWAVKPAIKRGITFKQLNLIEPWPMIPRMDIVFMRNVLIYFESQIKEQIISRIASVLKPNGYLFLGQSETLVQLKTPFELEKIDDIPSFRLKTRLQTA